MGLPQASFSLFGGVSLTRDGRPVTGRATQRRRVGLLTLLAAAPTGQVSRDRLVAFLWPEAETDAARHLLAGAVYELRKALGEDAIVSRGDELALNPDVVTCDLVQFENALAEHRLEDAVTLYRGTFADGLHVSQAPEYQQWLDDTRARYRQLFQKALASLAQRREREQAWLQAAEYWCRLLESDPVNAAALLSAMQALDAAGETARALRECQRYTTLVRREFEQEPDPRVAALADALRSRPAAPALIEPAAPAPPRQAPSVRAPVAGVRAVALWTLVAVWVLLLVTQARTGGVRAEVARAPVTEVVVLPGQSEDLATLLAAALDGAGPIRARLAGQAQPATPALYLEGGVVTRGGELRLGARLSREPGGEELLRTTVAGDSSRPGELLDRLALDLLGKWPWSPAERLSAVAARSTGSLAALRSWLAGERDFRSGHFLSAAEHFDKAGQADTGFALAFYRLSQARIAADLPDTDADEADHRLEVLGGSLPERERLLLTTWQRYRQGHAEYAEQRYQGLTTRYPDDLESWLQLGETRFHYGPLRGRPVGEAEVGFRRAVELDPANWNARWHLASLAALRGDRAQVEQWVSQLLATAPERSQELELRLLAALAAGDRTRADRVLTELGNADELLLIQCIWRTAVFWGDIQYAQRIAAILADEGRPAYARIHGLLTLANLRLAAGDPDGARREFDKARPFRSHYVNSALVAAMLLPGARVDSAELARVRAEVTQALARPGNHQSMLLRLLAYVAVLGGAPDSALALAERLERQGAATEGKSIRAEVAARAGRYDEVLSHVEQMGPPGWFGNEIGAVHSLSARVRYLRAEALFHLGQVEAALPWYRSLMEFSIADLAYLQPARAREREIRERLGRELARR